MKIIKFGRTEGGLLWVNYKPWYSRTTKRLLFRRASEPLFKGSGGTVWYQWWPRLKQWRHASKRWQIKLDDLSKTIEWGEPEQ